MIHKLILVKVYNALILVKELFFFFLYQQVYSRFHYFNEVFITNSSVCILCFRKFNSSMAKHDCYFGDFIID